jgi:hypothetical protein
MYVSGRISEDNIYYNTMKLSVQLVVMWLEPLYY